MPKTDTLKIEPQIYARIMARFRHAEIADLADHAKNHASLVRYLAKTNDLTTSEAADILDDCLIICAAPIDQAA